MEGDYTLLVPSIDPSSLITGIGCCTLVDQFPSACQGEELPIPIDACTTPLAATVLHVMACRTTKVLSTLGMKDKVTLQGSQPPCGQLPFALALGHAYGSVSSTSPAMFPTLGSLQSASRLLGQLTSQTLAL
jgi:hypothetical protein